MKKLLTAGQIAQVLDEMLKKILPDVLKDKNFAVIGIRSRGEILAGRLSAALSKKAGWEIPCGTLDISLYRDDFNTPNGAAQVKVQPTDIPFSIDDKFILLVDDVLHTGRSVRAAMDALTDLGRPKKVRLAVLVDRGNQELPIRADYVGIRTDVPLEQLVRVHLEESDGKEEVIVEKSS
jgi:pyrimidine operon attenuation protein/uracil phosphoribosyltransferase